MLVAKSMGAGEMTHGLRVLTALTFFQKRTLRGVGSLSTYTDFRGLNSGHQIGATSPFVVVICPASFV